MKKVIRGSEWGDLSSFIADLSLEIRTPVNTVLGASGRILRDCGDDKVLSEVRQIQDSGRDILTMINHLVELSKIQAGKTDDFEAEYAPAELLRELGEKYRGRAEEKGLSLSLSDTDSLPDKLSGDDMKIRQIVKNLLEHAVKNTAAGAVELGMFCQSADGAGESLVIEVKGGGAEQVGLDLAVTAMMVEQMGGELIRENEKENFVFTAVIPLGTKKAADRSVLVVDDDEMNRIVFEAQLENTGLRIVTADSGKQCLELAKEQSFDLIFMDHMMPGMDGVETLHEMRQIPGGPNHDTPVVALTANTSDDAREYYEKEGFADYLTKPVTDDLLLQMVGKYLPETAIPGDAAPSGEAVLESAPDSGDENEDAQTEEEADWSVYEQYGISIEHGLSFSRGQMDRYLKLVDMFLKDREKPEKLQQYRSEGNMKDYAILVHALKGNARTLGADELADIAFEHEKKSKADDAAYVNEHWEELMESYQRTNQGFEKLNGQYLPQENDSGDASGADAELLNVSQEDLNRVADLIDDFETDQAVEQMETWLKSPLESGVRGRIQEALAAIQDDYDEDKAMELLRG